MANKTLFQDETIVTATPHADSIEAWAECVWSDRTGDPFNENHHIWVCVPNDREGRESGESGMWVEIHSIESDQQLSEHPSQHLEFKQMLGKRVRVTVELVDEESEMIVEKGRVPYKNALDHEHKLDLVKRLKAKGYSEARIAYIMRTTTYEVRMLSIESREGE